MDSVRDIAIQAHESTNHLYDGKPYSVHLSMVVDYAKKYIGCIPGASRSDVINACWLHDVIEDCRFTYKDVKNIAGETVANIVYAVSNEKGRTREERANEDYYRGIRDTPFAIFVKLCDRLANLRYSSETNPKKLAMYSREHQHFIRSLFAGEGDKKDFVPMLNELSQLTYRQLQE
ncbi:MAG: HD domain-containing protein [Flavisolibacter sp.]